MNDSLNMFTVFKLFYIFIRERWFAKLKIPFLHLNTHFINHNLNVPTYVYIRKLEKLAKKLLLKI